MFKLNSFIDWPTSPAKINPNTTIISITKITAMALGNLCWFAHVIIGLQAIAIKTDNKNGTTIVVAAFTPASIMTIDAMITNILTEP
jgi:aspartyl aminopeptidase